MLDLLSLSEEEKKVRAQEFIENKIENMLVIHPDECIDCGVCEPECPVEAIHPDTDDGAESWVDMNRKYSELWPNITRKGEAPADAEAWKDVPDKFKKEFSENPGKGD